MREIWQVEKPTILFVTHDIEEAFFLSSKIYVMTPRLGKIKKEVLIHLPYQHNLELKDYEQFIKLRRETINLSNLHNSGEE